MKIYVALASLAFAILAFAAVWLGELNQDEGWYLYAAQLVSEGQMPYRDFFYTQGPAMPRVYACFSWIWRIWGILGARVATALLGLAGTLLAVAFVRICVPAPRRNLAATVVMFLLGSNLYHIYYTSIPKTYALAALFVAAGYCLLGLALGASRRPQAPYLLFASGLVLAFAAGTRISLCALLAVCGLGLVCLRREYPLAFLWFGMGGVAGIMAAYGPFVFDRSAFAGLCAAQQYHASRGGFDLVFTVGSLSRLVRWYAPVLVVLGLAVARAVLVRVRFQKEKNLPAWLALWGFLAVFAVQMLAPFPYEDYQVPVMGLLSSFAVMLAVAPGEGDDANRLSPPSLLSRLLPLLALGLTWSNSFGSPLLEHWMMAGQDRLWPRKKAQSDLSGLRDAAASIEALDPGGKTLLTQDLYLAIETGRKVPKGLEMGPFSILTQQEWLELLTSAPAPVAALSGYSFCINPPVCDERPVDEQVLFWDALKPNYELVRRMEQFGQNSTPLMILRKKVRP